MRIEELGWLRQSKGYSMDMMADFLGRTLDEYAELEFGLRQPESDETVILEKLFWEI